MIEKVKQMHPLIGNDKMIDKINEIIDYLNSHQHIFGGVINLGELRKGLNYLNAEKALPFEACKECIEVSKAIGRKVAEKVEMCPECRGKGRIEHKHSPNPDLIGMVMLPCPKCHGTGKPSAIGERITK